MIVLIENSTKFKLIFRDKKLAGGTWGIRDTGRGMKDRFQRVTVKRGYDGCLTGLLSQSIMSWFV